MGEKRRLTIMLSSGLRTSSDAVHSHGPVTVLCKYFAAAPVQTAFAHGGDAAANGGRNGNGILGSVS
jgi:hypothetical protein